MKSIIDIWYGDRQRFGFNGLCQRWINILGSVDAGRVCDLKYCINDSGFKKLSVGPDGHRLASSGDFNIELDSGHLRAGSNELTIEVKCIDGSSFTRHVDVVFAGQRAKMLPINICWDEVENISDVVQVIDGHWQKTDNGLRIIEPYYDRVIGIGDLSWQDYEVTAEVIFHGLKVPDASKGDAGANVIHAAIALRWPGHDTDGLQPRVKWYPLGATAEFRVNPGWQSCSWRILGGASQCVESRHSCDIRPGRKYILNHRVKTAADGSSVYSARMWQAGQHQPDNWQVEMRKTDGIQHGGCLLIAHYTDLEFGNIQVSQI